MDLLNLYVSSSLGPKFLFIISQRGFFKNLFYLIAYFLNTIVCGKKIISSSLEAFAKTHFKKPLNGLILEEATTLFRVLRVALGILFIMVLQSTSQSKGLNLAIYAKENPLSIFFCLFC